MKKNTLAIILFFLFLTSSNAQTVLLGDNAPFSNVNDGDFNKVWDYWRNSKQSPFWKTYALKGANKKNGIALWKFVFYAQNLHCRIQHSKYQP